MSSTGNGLSRGGSNPPLVLVFFSWWRRFGSTADRRLVVNIVLAKNHGLEEPVSHIDLAPRLEDTFAKLRRCIRVE